MPTLSSDRNYIPPDPVYLFDAYGVQLEYDKAKLYPFIVYDNNKDSTFQDAFMDKDSALRLVNRLIHDHLDNVYGYVDVNGVYQQRSMA